MLWNSDKHNRLWDEFGGYLCTELKRESLVGLTYLQAQSCVYNTLKAKYVALEKHGRKPGNSTIPRRTLAMMLWIVYDLGEVPRTVWDALLEHDRPMVVSTAHATYTRPPPTLLQADYSGLELREIASLSDFEKGFLATNLVESVITNASVTSGVTSANSIGVSSTGSSSNFQLKEPIVVKPFETVDFVYGQRVSDAKDTDLIASIKRIDKEILDLAPMADASKYVAQQIKDLNSMKCRIIEALDARL